jgi:hypothetical protein
VGQQGLVGDACRMRVARCALPVAEVLQGRQCLGPRMGS